MGFSVDTSFDKVTGYGPVKPLDSAKIKEEIEKNAAAKKADTVEISPEAGKKAALAARGEEFWTKVFGYKQGETSLENGNRMVVNITGTDIEVMVYDGDKLVRKETGTYAGNSVSRDIEFYDKSGDLVQKTHADIVGLEDEKIDGNKSSISRQIQWFKDGEMTRELRDKTLSVISYSGLQKYTGTELVPADSLEGAVFTITQEEIESGYTATLYDYNEDGSVRKRALINNKVHEERETNRTDDDAPNLGNHSSKVKSQENSLSIEMIEYDDDGKILKESSYEDAFSKSGERKMSLDVSWYNKGELVKKSNVDYTADASQGGLGFAPLNALGFFDVANDDFASGMPAGWSQDIKDTYASVEDQASAKNLYDNVVDNYYTGDLMSSSDILMKKYKPSADKGAAYTEELSRELKNHGNPQPGKLGIPYELSVTQELYSEGQLTYRETHEQKAKENTATENTFVRPGGSLTENDTPGLLHSTEHKREAYSEGQKVQSVETSMRESVARDENGVYKIDTMVMNSVLTNGHEAKNNESVGEYIAEIDNEAEAGSDAMTQELTQAFTDIRGYFGDIRDNDEALYDNVGMEYKDVR